MSGVIVTTIIILILTIGVNRNRVTFLILGFLVAIGIGLIDVKSLIKDDAISIPLPKVEAKTSVIPPFDYHSGITWMDYIDFKENDKFIQESENELINFDVTPVIGVPNQINALATKYGNRYGVEPAVFLAIACHERACAKGWYDNYVFGFGAYDQKPWGARFSGWKTQWSYAAPRIGRFFSRNTPTPENFQVFARDIYKTTAWKNYKNAYQFYKRFGGGNVKKNNEVAIFGDSIANGIATLMKEQVKVKDFTKASRRIDYDWETAIRQLNQNDTAFFLIGANDIPKDRKSYEKRVVDLITLFKQQGVNVTWLGIPNLTRGNLASKITMLNQIFEHQANENGIRFISLSQFKTDAGDGVHFKMKTYRQMAIQILNSI